MVQTFDSIKMKANALNNITVNDLYTKLIQYIHANETSQVTTDEKILKIKH